MHEENVLIDSRDDVVLDLDTRSEEYVVDRDLFRTVAGDLQGVGLIMGFIFNGRSDP